MSARSLFDSTLGSRDRRIRSLGTLLAGLLAIASLLLAWWTPTIFSGTALIQNLAIQYVGATVDERYSGGPILSKYRDVANDDFGAGSLEYPLAEAFQLGRCLDLLGFSAHEPSTDAIAFVQERFFWQFDYSLSALGPAVIHHYIDVDGAKGGRVDSPDGGELVRFDPGHPWDYMIEIDVAKGEAWLSDSSGEFRKKVPTYIVKEKKSVIVRIPLLDSSLATALDGRSTWHYVLVGAWDEYSRGHFMPLGSEASIRSGGGAESRFIPRVYDYLAPKSATQAEFLSLGARDDGPSPTILPVEVKEGAGNTKAIDEKHLATLKELAEAENAELVSSAIKKAKEQVAAASESAEKGANLDYTLIDAWLALQDSAKAERIADALLAQNKDDIRALANKGMLVAMRGGQAKSTGEAIDFVNLAFTYLDKAVKLAEAKPDSDEAIFAWASWAQMAISVPEIPFGKSRTGAYYFLKAADACAKRAATDPDAAKNEGRYLLLSGMALEIVKSPAEAETLYLRAISLKSLSSSLRYELAKRGYE